MSCATPQRRAVRLQRVQGFVHAFIQQGFSVPENRGGIRPRFEWREIEGRLGGHGITMAGEE